jgi:Na+-translocating ferredoxin:NAD+ oxidoreductase subunit B
MMVDDKLVTAIDDLLPQTQCGLCGFGGCKPYAGAIARREAGINLCPPGGTTTLMKLAELLNLSAEPFLEDMQKKAKPPSIAVIREAECIGCTKCIQACPVDAIIGSAKQMHSVITTECTGCELCVEPCPVDCIDIVVSETVSEPMQKAKALQARRRFAAHNQRLSRLSGKKNLPLASTTARDIAIAARKIAIQEAILRIKKKKGNEP